MCALLDNHHRNSDDYQIILHFNCANKKHMENNSDTDF